MLLSTKTVHVPAEREIAADLSEYGSIGWKCAAAYGHAAIEAGAPDYPDGDGDIAEVTGAVDAVANILHHIDYYEHGNPQEVLRRALDHFEAEKAEG